MRWDLFGVAVLLVLSAVLLVPFPIAGVLLFIITFIVIIRMFKKFKKDVPVPEDGTEEPTE